MKKGQSGIPQWLVFMILGVSLTMIMGATYYSIFVESQKSKESFEDLIEKINELKDGETLDYTLYLDSSDILVSFSDGKDYVGPSIIDLSLLFTDCKQDEKIKISPSCGSYPCLCICDTSLQYEFEESCTEHALVCYPFTDEKLTLYDHACLSDVYRKGASTGILQLHLQLKGDILNFCENADCIIDQHKETIEKFSEFINQYKSCLASESACSCDLDYSFLTKDYALNFYPDKIELYDANSKTPIVSESFTTNIALSIPDKQFTNIISLYLFKELESSEFSEYSDLPVQTYFVISTSLDEISLYGLEKQTEVETALLFQDSELYFTTEDLSQYTSCSIDRKIFL